MRYITEGLPGTGGLFKATPEDFLVEEVPAYLPQGSGEHTFLWIEKRGLNTREALSALCRALSTRESDAGTAGQKDRHAVTRQWISLPRVDPAAARGLTLTPRAGDPGTVTVLAAERHNNKLRTGHLRGNRFTLTLRDTEEGLSRAQAILGRLFETGLPNRYGTQRFGHGGRNEEEGRRLVRGDLRTGGREAQGAAVVTGREAQGAAVVTGREAQGAAVVTGRATVKDRFRRRFLVSAYQSALFNRYLDSRHEDGLLSTVLVGDILEKRDSGGLFTAAEADVADAQQRLTQGLLSVTGPIFGSRMRAPTPGTAPPDREAAILAEEQLTPETFAALGNLAEGTRRALLVEVGQDPTPLSPHPEDPTAIILSFTLPSGSYATVLLGEIMKPKDPLQIPEPQ